MLTLVVDDKYPVVPDLSSFQFPHRNLPSSWLSDSLKISNATGQPREANFSAVVLSRDVSCRLTNHTLGTESAHLVPRVEESWFTSNSMFQYSVWNAKMSPDDPRNVVLLRSDIHTLFEAQHFAIVPKKGVWVAHVLSGPAEDELATLYHNVQLQPLEGMAVEFLFARFAWTVFSQSTFILPAIKRTLVVIRPDTLEQARQEMTGAQYKANFAPRSRTKSRSQSPKKRARGDEAEDEAAVLSDTSEESESMLRGRPRRRLYDDMTVTSSYSSAMLVESRATSISRPAADDEKSDARATQPLDVCDGVESAGV